MTTEQQHITIHLNYTDKFCRVCDRAHTHTKSTTTTHTKYLSKQQHTPIQLEMYLCAHAQRIHNILELT